jgi:uncharacterized repeat protein (TIGR01451 family)
MKKLFTKIILALAFLGLSFNSIQAQYVTIPDANFANWLDTHYPFMNGNEMDTVWANVYNVSNMNIPSLGISNLFGVQYITNLNSLNVNNNLLTTLPPLPPNLTYLQCKGNPISVLPTLPNSITNLSCGSLQLTQISNLPSNLTTFYCEYASLSSLPQLPASITSFTLNFGSISTLPSFPTSLLVLDLSQESITTLPNPLPTSLQHLIFPNNSVTTLPPLPNSLIVLSAAYNQITCFPTLPNTINNMVIVGNPFTCLPNYIPAMDAATLAMPLCQTNDVINNPNNCPAATLNCNTCVIIPDPNFVNWLTLNYPSCMQGNQMDTTCYEIVNETKVDFGGSENTPVFMPNITGIQYFDNLDTLYCINASMNFLAELPQGLLYLDCSINQLTQLPLLPQGLLNFSCASNQITQLPQLPGGLINLSCNSNYLTQLPTLPNTLTYLACGNNTLISIPPIPSSLITLYCANNNLNYLFPNTNNLMQLTCSNNPLNGSLPILNNGLYNLYCENIGATNLPTLPPTLDLLYCGGNPLTSLPTLPNSLWGLYCSSCNLSQLPTLPNSLQALVCSFNQLTNLPTLPNYIWALDCSNNNITCFPTFPASFNDIAAGLNISNNPFTCLPNYVSCMNLQTLAYPLCISGDTINNPQNCSGSTGITGKIIFDSISNCQIDVTEHGLKNVKVDFFNPINNTFSSVTSAINGTYQNNIQPSVNLVSIDTSSIQLISNCNYPGLDTVVTTTLANPLAEQVNFYLECKPGIDLGVMSSFHISGIVFPGQQHTLKVVAGDLSQWFGMNCANGASGTLNLTITGPITYSGTPSGALVPIVNGNNYSYTINDFGSVDITSAFLLNFTVNTTAQSGDLICVNATITATNTDYEQSNDSLNYCYLVVNSYDPNYKEAYPTNVAPGYQDWITYTIHFQNLGTAPAFNINIKDTLDTNLNHQTFEIINYSHNYTSVLQNGIVTFLFQNIMLPDSASDPSGSQGFIQYRIKPLANLPVGTQIENTAHIYFDFNPAIVTNTTVNNFVTTVANTSISENKKLFVYPNPSTGNFTISAAANIEVYNLIGDLILSENNATSIDLTASPKGMYFVKLNGGRIEKLIKN